MRVIDAKLKNPLEKEDPSASDMMKNYLLSRFSSAIRIPVNSVVVGIAGAFFGAAKAIYLDIPKRQLMCAHGFGSFGMALIYFSVHETVNGIVRRSIGREQIFYSHTAAAVATNLVTFAYMNRSSRVLLLATALRSMKYTWTLSVAAMAADMYFVQVRHYLIKHGISSQKKELFHISRTPSEGTRWLEMKKKEKLREQAHLERYGTPSHILTQKDNMTFENLKENVKLHTEQEKLQNKAK